MNYILLPLGLFCPAYYTTKSRTLGDEALGFMGNGDGIDASSGLAA